MPIGGGALGSARARRACSTADLEVSSMADSGIPEPVRAEANRALIEGAYDQQTEDEFWR